MKYSNVNVSDIEKIINETAKYKLECIMKTN